MLISHTAARRASSDFPVLCARQERVGLNRAHSVPVNCSLNKMLCSSITRTKSIIFFLWTDKYSRTAAVADSEPPLHKWVRDTYSTHVKCYDGPLFNLFSPSLMCPRTIKANNKHDGVFDSKTSSRKPLLFTLASRSDQIARAILQN